MNQMDVHREDLADAAFKRSLLARLPRKLSNAAVQRICGKCDKVYPRLQAGNGHTFGQMEIKES